MGIGPPLKAMKLTICIDLSDSKFMTAKCFQSIKIVSFRNFLRRPNAQSRRTKVLMRVV